MGISDVISLLGGIALFLFGMSLMGEGLKKVAGSKLELVLYRLSSTPLKGVLLGTGVTAVIQSSSATSVMVVGFVNSGMMKVRQAIGVIMGAILGTSVTGWIICLSALEGGSGWVSLLSTATLTGVVAVIGIILRMFCKKQSKVHIGDILMGFAVLMFGMQAMSGSVAPLQESEAFLHMLTTFSNPILGILVGLIFTCVLQSASAAVGILQALAGEGLISLHAAIFVLFGQNIGTCVTAMLSSVGTNKNARRAAVVHLSFNIIGTVVWLTLFESANAIFRFAFVSTAIDTFHIALIHSIFNLACTLMLLPCCGLLEKLSYKVIPEGQHADATTELDERLFATPAIALVKSEELAKRMAADSELALHESLQAVLGFTPELAASVRQREDDTDRYEDTLGTFLVHLATQPMSEQDSVESSKLLHLIGDFERIADHAVNIIESAEELKEKGVSFTDSAKKELQTMLNAVSEIVDLTSRAFLQDDLTLARQVEPLEQVIDKLKNELRTNHIARLQRGECSLAAGFVLSDLLTNLERVADHCSNIAGCLLDMKNERIDLHKYLGDVKSGSNEFLMQYNTFEEKYKLA
mgnify:CR=1 FL=1